MRYGGNNSYKKSFIHSIRMQISKLTWKEKKINLDLAFGTWFRHEPRGLGLKMTNEVLNYLKSHIIQERKVLNVILKKKNE